MEEPLADAMNGGVQWTRPYERTGLLTPPGMRAWASLNAASE